MLKYVAYNNNFNQILKQEKKKNPLVLPSSRDQISHSNPKSGFFDEVVLFSQSP